MRNIDKALYVLLLILYILTPSFLFGYDGKTTHREINNNAVDESKIEDLLKDRLGISKGLYEKYKNKELKWWIEEGGEMEDATILKIYIRPLNHFHDPLVDTKSEKTWEDAGLWTGKSLVVWTLYLDDSILIDYNAFSWPAARKYFYNALVGYNYFYGDIQPDESTEDNYALTFRSLGQLMHLVSDASVPAHVRGDAHPGLYGTLAEDMYEKWAKANAEKKDSNGNGIINYEALPVEPSIFNKADLNQTPLYLNSPITALLDQNKYTGTNPEITWDSDSGLTEFTNANFFSQDTISGEYSYPDPSSTANIYVVVAEDGKQENVYYIEHPDEGYRLATYSFITKYYYGGSWTYANYTIDDNVCQDYAEILIPRAVGYSAALLDYFFRGDFHLSQAVFGQDENGNLSGVDMMVTNTSRLSEDSTEIEAIGSGEISIVCKYLPIGESEYEYIVDENAYTLDEDGYIDGQAETSINDGYVSISTTFDEPIPYNATNVSLTIVFKGKMGNENDAVAARTFDFSSRISFYSVDSDYVNNVYAILPDGTDERQLTDADDLIPGYFAPSYSADGRLMGFLVEDCTVLNEDNTCNWSNYSRDIWVVDLYSQEDFPNNVVNIFSSRVLEEFDDWADSSETYLSSFSFSPDGSQIVAIANDANGSLCGLVIFDILTGDYEFIVHNDSGNWEYGDLANAPEWSPNGDEIVFCRAHSIWYSSGGVIIGGRKPEIYTISPNGGDAVRLTDADNDDVQTQYTDIRPSWSPDGEQIIFVSDRDGGDVMDLWIMDRDGSNMQQILDCESDCYSPSFSPSGEQITFEMDSNIYVVNRDGSGLEQITSFGGAKAPFWAPWTLEP